ncbi:hypothetical protein Tco_0620588 [Tanacetum coccineum]
MNSNTASTSGSGTLTSNTNTNPKVDLKGITTRSGVAYQGPTIPATFSSPPKVVKRETEVTKDTVLPTNNERTEDVQPPVVQVQPQVPNSEPAVAPVSAPMSNLKPTIPYPSRRNDEKRHEKANDQIEKFYKIIQDRSFEISLANALILMPKFALFSPLFVALKVYLRREKGEQKRRKSSKQNLVGFDLMQSPDHNSFFSSPEKEKKHQDRIRWRSSGRMKAKSPYEGLGGWVGKILGTSTGMSSTTLMVESPESG